MRVSVFQLIPLCVFCSVSVNVRAFVCSEEKAASAALAVGVLPPPRQPEGKAAAASLAGRLPPPLSSLPPPPAPASPSSPSAKPEVR